jgi:hypothetical protein
MDPVSIQMVPISTSISPTAARRRRRPLHGVFNGAPEEELAVTVRMRRLALQSVGAPGAPGLFPAVDARLGLPLRPGGHPAVDGRRGKIAEGSAGAVS